MNIETLAKELKVSAPTLRKWIYANADKLMADKVVLIMQNGKRRTVRILNDQKLIDYFFNK
jgi:hypothetical protein